MKSRLLILSALVILAFTVNAQSNWRQQYTNMAGVTVGVDQVVAVDGNTAWVNGFEGSGEAVAKEIKVHARTNDGGETWVPGIYNGMTDKVYPQVLAAASYDKAYCTAMDTATQVTSFWKTVDGGATWTKYSDMFVGGASFANTVSFWGNTNKGFCMGDPINGEFEVYLTSDGGVTWTLVNAANIPDPIAGEYGYNGTACVAVGKLGVAGFITNKGRVYVTNDYGVNWTVSQTTFTDLNKIAISDANTVIAAKYNTGTQSYDMVKTVDGGTTWNAYVPTSGSLYPYQLSYVPNTVNMFVSSSPFTTIATGVSYSYNGGADFADFYDDVFLQNAQSANVQMLGFAFSDSTKGWVGNYNMFGEESTILRYDLTSIKHSAVGIGADDQGNALANAVTGNGNFDEGASVTLTAVAPANFKFTKWVSYPAATDLSTNYQYTFTMGNANVAVIAVFAPSGDGVAENEFGTLSVSPNPATNNVVISMDNKQNGIFNMNVVDMTGKLVYNGTIESNASVTLDVTTFAKGVYFVKINNDAQQFVQNSL